MPGKIERILFSPTTNKVLSTMDDSRSSIALATTDFVGSSGRTYMEYKRDTDGGRERLYEEFLTWVIWGFGIKTAKSLYDKALQSDFLRDRLNIHFPNMDVDMLPAVPGQAVQKSVKNPKWNKNFGDWLKAQVFPEVTQTLKPDLVQQFRDSTIHKSEAWIKYDNLLKVVSDPKKFNQKYYLSNLAKFSIATMAPVLLIAFGIPTFNQMITRKKFEAQKPNHKDTKTPAASATAPQHANAFGGFPYRMGQGMPFSQTMGQQPRASFSNPGTAFNTPQPTYPTSFGPSGFGFPQAATPFASAGQPMSQQPMWQQRFAGHAAQPGKKDSKKKDVQFGSMGNMVQKLASGSSLFLQNDQLNTLLVDNTITAGRLYKGRNTLERLEILFREASIITFLYFARKPIQDFIGNVVGKMVSGEEKIPVEMEFKTIKSLIDHNKSNPEFFGAFKKHLKALTIGSVDNASQIKFKSDKAIVDAIRKEFLNKGGSKNGIFEIARHIGWIPTMDKEQMLLDLTQKIDVDSIKTMARSVKELSRKAGGDSHKFQDLLKKAMKIRSGAWLLSNVVCFVYLSLLVPKIQHMITRWKTGKDFFPGTQGYKQQLQQQN